jgi:hypothetical protein
VEWGLCCPLVELEDALAVAVDVCNDGGEHEEEDAEEPDGGGIGAWVEGGEGLGPRVEEDDFDIEDKEDHGDEIEADIEAFTGGVDRGHPGFVGNAFSGTFSAWAEDCGSDEVHDGESCGGEEHEEDGEVCIDRVACEGD